MPITSRSILSKINAIEGGFTAEELVRASSSERQHSGKKTGGKTNTRRGAKSLERIETMLAALLAAGYLEKKKKRYARSASFSCAGVIKIKGRDDTVLQAADGTTYAVRREHLNNAHNNDAVEAEIVEFQQGVLYARVTRILKRKKEFYTARVTGMTKSMIFYRLIDLAGGAEACSSRSGSKPAVGDCAIVQLTGKIIAGIPECTVEETFDEGDELYDVRRIILKHSLPGPHGDYEELASKNAAFIESELKHRKNLKKFYTVTIDGDNAKDFDDAISFEKTRDGYSLYVHIADVSAFVDKGTPLDAEATRRGTSFYVGNTVIPMLPELLSNDLCSLREGVDRITLSVRMKFNRRGDIVGHEFFRGIIRVNKRLTYATAHELIESGKKTKLPFLLRQMYDFAQLLKERRMQNGRVDLNLTDSEFIYKGNTLVDLITTQRLKSHLIIEEFMLSANETVSRALREHGIPALYRVHESISDEKLVTLVRFLNSLGLTMSKKKDIGKTLQGVIDSVRGMEYEEVVNFIILKSMMQAYYGVEPLGHFGLGFKDYTHFTSPIRRYPDLVVHRCLKSIIDAAPAPYDIEELRPLGEKSSEMERVAQSAERDLFRLKSCRLLDGRTGEVFDAVVSGVGRSGFYVTLMEKPIEGMVPLRMLTDDYYLVQEDDFTVVGKRLGRRFRLGDRIRVRLVGVDAGTMRIDFEIA